MNFRSLSDKIVVQDIKTEVNFGVLLISASAATLRKAEIKSVGDECVKTLLVGDVILYQKEHAEDILVEGKPYKMLRQKDIWVDKP